MIDVAHDDLIEQCDVCKRFRITPETFRNWRLRGLECVKLGKHWYTTAAALNAFARPSEVKQERPPYPGIDQASHRAATEALNNL